MKRFLIAFMILELSFLSVPVMAISDTQEKAIKSHCETIKVSLKTLQRTDARARVYLGGYYETILSKFITPLNMRLVENSLSNADLVENQNKFVETKNTFVNDFIKYQQMLEELITINCKEEPEEFYDELVTVRQRRKIMEQDVLKLRSLISEHIKLVYELEGKI